MVVGTLDWWCWQCDNYRRMLKQMPQSSDLCLLLATAVGRCRLLGAEPAALLSIKRGLLLVPAYVRAITDLAETLADASWFYQFWPERMPDWTRSLLERRTDLHAVYELLCDVYHRREDRHLPQIEQAATEITESLVQLDMMLFVALPSMVDYELTAIQQELRTIFVTAGEEYWWLYGMTPLEDEEIDPDVAHDDDEEIAESEGSESEGVESEETPDDDF